MNQKFVHTRPDGYFDIRVFHRKRNGKRDPRFLFKCGCCDRYLEVYYGDDSLEINGVMGSVANWRDLLMPLLNMSPPGPGPGKRHRFTDAAAVTKSNRRRTAQSRAAPERQVVRR